LNFLLYDKTYYCDLYPKNVSRDTIQKIRVEQISPNPNQARINFDKAGLVELAESIKATGLLQTIIVKPVGNRFQIIAGERRWRAHQLSGFSEIDAIIRNSDNSMAPMTMIGIVSIWMVEFLVYQHVVGI
jgi:ParB family transcriptional regulator, chromosome partitioning protein